MNLTIFQKGFHYRQDGPGNRLVIHLQGCNMHCPWCANPEGISQEGTLMCNTDTATEDLCPYHAITHAGLDRSICRVCISFPCIKRGGSRPIRHSSWSVSLAKLLDEIESSRRLFFDNGGVTLSGGEPTKQLEPIRKLFLQLDQRGINTALETNGTHPQLHTLFDCITYLIIDLKHYDPYMHMKVTGAELHRVTSSISKAAAGHPNVTIRITLIGSINSSPKDMKGFIDLAQQSGWDSCSFEFLQFHPYGEPKRIQCGMPQYPKEYLVTPGTLEAFQDAFTQAGLQVVRT